MNYILDKVISGGQTGADQGILVAAKQLKIPTGGWIPRGFMTEAGPCPDLGPLYGLQEHPSSLYPPRTRRNVKESDGTLWLGGGDSRGYACTKNAVDEYEKPFIVNPTPVMLLDWLDRWKIKILNGAGNRASKDATIHTRMATLLIQTLTGDYRRTNL